jgi:hypothetical protein
MSELARLGEQLPGARAGEQLLREASTLLELLQPANPSRDAENRRRSYEEVVKVIDEILPAAGELGPTLETLKKPATKLEIAKHLAILVQSFPNVGKNNAEVFGRMLVEDTAAQQPTVGGLESACRHIRRTNRFIPAIAEFLTALAEAEASQRQIIKAIFTLPEQRRRLLDRIALEEGQSNSCVQRLATSNQKEKICANGDNEPV